MAKSQNSELSSYLTGEYATDALTVPSVTEAYYVKNYDRLSKLNYCGYVHGDRYGYISAAMLLYYVDFAGIKDVMPNSSYWVNGSICVLDSNFTQSLINIGENDLGFSGGTTSYSIHRVVKEYLKHKNITADHHSISAPLISKNATLNHITDNQPVIIFGSLRSPPNNEALAYGCKPTITGNTSVFNFLAHFGYNNYTGVWISGTFGSYYTFTP